VRHAQTEANAARILQGHGQSSLTELGTSQAKALAARLDGSDYDLRVTSDLDRALQTAESLGGGFEASASWRELDIGAWEGMSWEEVRIEFGGDLERLRAGADVAFGGGETLEGFAVRAGEAFEELAARLGSGARALVVTHGGVINQILKAVCGLPVRSRRFGRSTNTSITRLIRGGSDWTVSSFNDSLHLGAESPFLTEHLGSGNRAAFLVRHGQTEANLSGRWQGASDQGLNATGRMQATAVASRLSVDAVFSSPLRRAIETAAVLDGGVSARLGGLAELHMGEWEDLTAEEIQARAPDAWRRIFVEGEDLPRGGTGETWEEVGMRFEEAVGTALSSSEGARIGLVSHGAAIGAYLCRVLEIPHPMRRRLSIVDNASVTTVVYGDQSAIVADFNVCPY